MTKIGVGDHRPKASSPSAVRRRIHSPYCESTGPIVQEGFVSSRINALLALQAQKKQFLVSPHSPLTPCRTSKPPRPLKSIGVAKERGAAPVPDLSDGHSQASSHLATANKDTSDIRTPPRKLSSPEAHNAERLADPLSNDQTSSNPGREHNVLSPRAIPSRLAQPFDRTIKLRQQYSVAERLGSMVEQGWSTSGALDDAFNGNASSKLELPATPQDLNALKCTSIAETSNFRPGLVTPEAKNTVQRVSDTGPAASIGAMGITRSTSNSKIPRPETMKLRRSRSFSHAHQPQEPGEQLTKSPAHSFSSHGYGQKRPKSGGDVSQTINVYIPQSHVYDDKITGKQTLHPSSTNPRAPSPRSTSSNTNATPKILSRKSSALTNLLTGKWLKMVVTDNKAKLADLSRMSSTSALTIAPHTMANCDYERLEKTSETKDLEVQKKQRSVSGGTRGSASDLRTNVMKGLDSRPTLSKTTELPISPAQARSSQKEFISPSAAIRLSRKPEKKTPGGANVLGGCHCRSPRIQEPYTARDSADDFTIAQQDSAEATDYRYSAEVAHDGLSANSVGIKKIRVIVTFHGPEDLVVETRLEDQRE